MSLSTTLSKSKLSELSRDYNSQGLSKTHTNHSGVFQLYKRFPEMPLLSESLFCASKRVVQIINLDGLLERSDSGGLDLFSV